MSMGKSLSLQNSSWLTDKTIELFLLVTADPPGICDSSYPCNATEVGWWSPKSGILRESAYVFVIDQ